MDGTQKHTLVPLGQNRFFPSPFQIGSQVPLICQKKKKSEKANDSTFSTSNDKYGQTENLYLVSFWFPRWWESLPGGSCDSCALRRGVVIKRSKLVPKEIIQLCT